MAIIVRHEDSGCRKVQRRVSEDPGRGREEQGSRRHYQARSARREARALRSGAGAPQPGWERIEGNRRPVQDRRGLGFRRFLTRTPGSGGSRVASCHSRFPVTPPIRSSSRPRAIMARCWSPRIATSADTRRSDPSGRKHYGALRPRAECGGAQADRQRPDDRCHESATIPAVVGRRPGIIRPSDLSQRYDIFSQFGADSRHSLVISRRHVGKGSRAADVEP